MRVSLLAVLLICCAWLVPSRAMAASCWISGNVNIAFGDVGAAGGSTSGSLSYTCQKDWTADAATYTFRLCVYVAEGAPIGGVNPRYLTNNNGSSMKYDLYSDSSHTSVLGAEGSGYTLYTTLVTASGAGNAQISGTLPIYAKVYPGQSPVAGSYQSQIGGGSLRYLYNASSAAPDASNCLSGTKVGFYTGVTATYANTCRINAASDLDFGTVTNLSSEKTQTSTIQLQCPSGAAWQVSLDNGSNASGTTRRMTDGNGHYLTYELYRDSGHSQRWGNTLGSDTGTGSGSNATQSLTVHGRTPAQATQASGTYSDTVTATLTF